MTNYRYCYGLETVFGILKALARIMIRILKFVKKLTDPNPAKTYQCIVPVLVLHILRFLDVFENKLGSRLDPPAGKNLYAI
jgi:hypothetical protein